MQIKKTYPLDALPTDLTNVIYSAEGTGVISGFVTQTPVNGVINNTNWYLITVVNSGGRKWMKGVNNVNCFSVPLGQLGLAWTGKVVIGYRMITNTPSSSRSGSLLNSAGSTALYETICDGTGTSPLLTANTECYVECVLDFVANTYTRYVDGKSQSQAVYSFTAAQMASIISTYPYFWIGAYTGAATNWYIRDVHVREYTSSETYTPFADAVVTRLGITATVGSDWSASDGGTIQDVLNFPFNNLSVDPISGSKTYPFAEAPKGSAASAIQLTLGGFTSLEGTIAGVEFFETAKSLEGTAAALTPKWTQNSTDLVLTKQTLGAAYGYRKPIGLASTMPDGTTITNAKLTGSVLTLTPSAS